MIHRGYQIKLFLNGGIIWFLLVSEQLDTLVLGWSTVDPEEICSEKEYWIKNPKDWTRNFYSDM